jgi:hypothetical protein
VFARAGASFSRARNQATPRSACRAAFTLSLYTESDRRLAGGWPGCLHRAGPSAAAAEILLPIAAVALGIIAMDIVFHLAATGSI